MKPDGLWHKNNGLGWILVIGKHPMKDYLAISSGTEDDIRWVPLSWFITNYSKAKKEAKNDRLDRV